MSHSPCVDLHLHSSKSDGTCSPKELVRLAEERNIKIISLTDHDTVAGVCEAKIQAEKSDIKFISGIEISAKYKGGTLHILGYGIDVDSKPFLDKISKFQNIRKNRNRKIVKKLNELGIKIDIDEMMEKSMDIYSLGRPHIAEILIKRGLVKNMDEAFDRYLGRNKKAFVKKEVFTSDESIKIIHEAGGKAFLAHPVTLNLEGARFIDYLDKLVKHGLDGIEVYATLHSPEKTQFYKTLAIERNLMISAGSDFHGDMKPETPFGICNNGKKVNSNLISYEFFRDLN
ncbi:PHP domain-containing protein [bacterium]|nr:PHP domain-containing protein [bacterium]